MRTQPLTATGAPSQTSTMPYHTQTIPPLFGAYVSARRCVWEGAVLCVGGQRYLHPSATCLQRPSLASLRSGRCRIARRIKKCVLRIRLLAGEPLELRLIAMPDCKLFITRPNSVRFVDAAVGQFSATQLALPSMHGIFCGVFSSFFDQV